MNKQTFKSSATSRFSCFLVFFLPIVVFGQTSRRSFTNFSHLLPRKHVTKIGLILLKTPEKVSITNFSEDVICNACDPRHTLCFTSFMIASTDNIRIYKNDKWGKKMWRKIENSIFWGSKDREFELVIKKGWRKIKDNEFNITYLLIHNVKIILMLLMSNLSHQKI